MQPAGSLWSVPHRHSQESRLRTCLHECPRAGGLDAISVRDVQRLCNGFELPSSLNAPASLAARQCGRLKPCTLLGAHCRYPTCRPSVHQLAARQPLSGTALVVVAGARAIALLQLARQLTCPRSVDTRTSQLSGNAAWCRSASVGGAGRRPCLPSSLRVGPCVATPSLASISWPLNTPPTETAAAGGRGRWSRPAAGGGAGAACVPRSGGGGAAAADPARACRHPEPHRKPGGY